MKLARDRDRASKWERRRRRGTLLSRVISGRKAIETVFHVLEILAIITMHKENLQLVIITGGQCEQKGKLTQLSWYLERFHVIVKKFLFGQTELLSIRDLFQ